MLQVGYAMLAQSHHHVPVSSSCRASYHKPEPCTLSTRKYDGKRSGTGM